METHVNERLKQFTKYFIEDFEVHIEAQLTLLEGNTSASDKYQDLILQSLKGLCKSPISMLKNFGEGAKNCLMNQKKMDIAGKLTLLVEKYKDENEKQMLRKLFVNAAFELFRSFEQQFMSAEKHHGGSLRAMLHLARAAVWCFIRYYIFYNKEELTEKFILEAITLKISKDISLWQKIWYSESKTNTKVTCSEDNVKWDPIDLFVGAGIIIEKQKKSKYFINKLSKYEIFGFRRQFTHEVNNITDYEETEPLQAPTYKYVLDMSTETKESMCQFLLESVNEDDDSLMEKRLVENMERISQNTVECLLCDLFQKLRLSVQESIQECVTTTNINNTSIDQIADIQIADNIVNFKDNICTKEMTFFMQ